MCLESWNGTSIEYLNARTCAGVYLLCGPNRLKKIDKQINNSTHNIKKNMNMKCKTPHIHINVTKY